MIVGMKKKVDNADDEAAYMEPETYAQSLPLKGVHFSMIPDMARPQTFKRHGRPLHSNQTITEIEHRRQAPIASSISADLSLVASSHVARP